MSDENNKQPQTQPENELSENELDEISGGAIYMKQPATNQVLIGLLLPAVNVSAGDVNCDGSVMPSNTLGK